ncbi:hypothetical protein EIB71_02355 [Kaistella daneshvariae]|uniref:WGxxGxxG-CTERM domain-containing protein n=1 Tax=Kaistella daneshvariae TaxID=2487074 RepID=A0ABM7C6K1_9FLAO|nr:hypothetical protein [Kaistella daneshvariae]AZI66593.1 hypothetical protein EIB71_02355 [Kaistella daneshvariae]
MKKIIVILFLTCSLFSNAQANAYVGSDVNTFTNNGNGYGNDKVHNGNGNGYGYGNGNPNGNNGNHNGHQKDNNTGSGGAVVEGDQAPNAPIDEHLGVLLIFAFGIITYKGRAYHKSTTTL